MGVMRDTARRLAIVASLRGSQATFAAARDSRRAREAGLLADHIMDRHYRAAPLMPFAEQARDLALASGEALIALTRVDR